jgi:outer membrane protein assembly factor BamE (lipoprotein component of BamABCDE complex)
MSRTKKRVVIILSIAVALFAFEAGREYIVYRVASNRLEGGYWKLQGRTGMTKEEVRALVGEPDRAEAGATDENWYWYARESRGPLWKMVSRSGGYELNVQFDKTGRMLDVYSKVD